MLLRNDGPLANLGYQTKRCLQNKTPFARHFDDRRNLLKFKGFEMFILNNVHLGRFLSRMHDSFEDNHPTMLLRNDGPLIN